MKEKTRKPEQDDKKGNTRRYLSAQQAEEELGIPSMYVANAQDSEKLAYLIVNGEKLSNYEELKTFARKNNFPFKAQ